MYEINGNVIHKVSDIIDWYREICIPPNGWDTNFFGSMCNIRP